jgi:cellulose synthase/poly-beta-1,6-N-acetylglucosamine synthase-like glycosyltransferase
VEKEAGPKTKRPIRELPDITIIIIAHNEADVIEERIQNCLAVDYPSEKIEIIVASDASTDETVELARSTSPRVRAFNNTPHNKSETRNMAVERASNDIVLFTDADTRYEPDCVDRIVERYDDPEVGAVCGTLVSESFNQGAVGQGMGLYWRWEQFLKKLQGDLGLLVKFSGANMSMRTSYYEPVPDTVDIDQIAGFVTVNKGGRSVFESRAVAHEQFPVDLESEFSTRRRLTIRALTALWQFRGSYSPTRYPLFAVNTVSYWLLRYFMPYLLAGTFLLSLILSFSNPFVFIFLLLQCAFYLSAVAGYVLERVGAKFTLFSVPFSYCWASFGILTGGLAFLFGERVYAYSAVS